MDQTQPKLNDDKKKTSELTNEESLNDVDKKKATDLVKKESFQAQLNLKDSIKKEELELKLKEATSLSEKQISEVADVILEKLTKIQKDIEEQNTKNDSKRDLERLSQSVINSPNVDMKLRDNNGTIVGSMNVNKTTNNINITINQTEQKIVQVKPIETKPVQTKPIETKPVQTKPIETKPVQTKPVETKLNTSVNGTPDVHTLVGFLTKIDKLLLEIEDTKEGISKKHLSKAGKKGMDNAKEKLKQYEKVLKGKKEGLQKQNKAEIYDNDIEHLNNLEQQINKVRKDIGMSQWGELSDTAGYLYNSPENAKEANKRQMSSIEFNQKLQEETKKGAILNIFNGNVQTATDFYRRIAQGEYTQADYQLFTTNAAILTPSFQNCGIAVPMWPIQANLLGKEYTSGSYNSSPDYSKMDWGETFEKGGVAGLFGKGLSNCKNMTPGQRDMWKSLGVLGCVAGLLYGGYKFFTSKKISGRGKAGITAAAIFGSQALTGEGPISLIGKALTGGWTKEYIESKFGGGVFGDAVDGVGKSGIEASETIVPSTYSMMIFNPTTTVGDVRNLTATFRTDENAWPSFRQGVIDNLEKNSCGKACVERFSAMLPSNYDDQKRNGLLTSIGITDSTSDKRTVHELANNSTFNEVALTKFKSDNGLQETDDPVKKQELHDYINNKRQKNQAIDATVLEAHKNNDWFKSDNNMSYTEREEDRQNKEELANQVNSLSISLEKKRQLRQAIQTFYDERTINNKPILSDFSLKMRGGYLIVRSHGGEETKININNNSIKGFGSKNGNNYAISFGNLSDLFHVADLTNDILSMQKGQAISSFPPFQYKISRKGICFNDADTLSFNMDTRILSTGWRGATSKVDTLYEHPEEYAQYLSNRWIEDNRVNVDSRSYPLAKKLSESGIIFFNEQEVRNMEVRLKGIKERLKVFKCYPKGNPFSIKVLSNSLRFKTINGKMEEFSGNILDMFPTLKYEGNEDRLLNMLNNPSNKMWGSAF